MRRSPERNGNGGRSGTPRHASPAGDATDARRGAATGDDESSKPK
ncbi:hypothetical protein C7S14_6942 [Burkholderia cepacia]|nr:hypothetical protein C7S14_6942 [Burkholderia cepacia]